MILEDAYVGFIIEHKLTQGQLLLLYLLYKNRGDLIRQYKETFPAEDGTMIGQRLIDDLYQREFLIKNPNGSVSLSNKFKEIFINKHLATEEVFDLYPTHFSKEGLNIPLTAMDRNVFSNIYDIAIQSSIIEHLEVIKDIKFAKEKQMLNIGLDKFVKSHYWKVIRAIRLETTEKEEIPSILDSDF